MAKYSILAYNILSVDNKGVSLMEKRYNESNKVTVISIVLNIFLTIIKIFAGVIGKSNAIIADGLHSASDIVTSVGVLIGNKISRKPKDVEHQYGHEKAETIVAFILSAVLIIVALDIGIQGIKALFNPSGLGTPTILPLIVSVISILVKEYQYRITIKVAKKINSPSLKADAWHHRSDALSSIAAFIGIGGAILGFKILDPIASITVALVVVKVGVDIFKTSCNELMDTSINPKDLKLINSIANNYSDIKGISSIKSRKHGSYAYIDMSILIDHNKTLCSAHEISHKLEKLIISELPYIKEINIHIEPYSKG